MISGFSTHIISKMATEQNPYYNRWQLSILCMDIIRRSYIIWGNSEWLIINIYSIVIAICSYYNNYQGFEYFSACGFGGQRLCIIPSLEVPIVLISEMDRPHPENNAIIRNVVSLLQELIL